MIRQLTVCSISLISLSACSEWLSNDEAWVPNLAVADGSAPQAVAPFDLPGTRDFQLTNTQPGALTGYRIFTVMQPGQQEIYSAVIQLPPEFSVNSFETIGPIGTIVGTYGFDFDTSTLGIPERVLQVRSLSATRAYVDSNLDGAYQQVEEPTIEYANTENGPTITLISPFGGDGRDDTLSSQFFSNIVANAVPGVLTNPVVAGDYQITATFTSVDPDGGNDGRDNGTGEDPQVLEDTMTVTIANPPLRAAVLPTSRSVPFNSPATVFATIVNNGDTTATDCEILPSSVTTTRIGFQTTDPNTNALTGTANTPVSIPAGSSQSFLLVTTPFEEFFVGAVPFQPLQVEYLFDCANTLPAPILPGINTLQLSASSTPTADVIAIAATASNDGRVSTGGPNSNAAFAAAGLNIGTSESITVRPRAVLNWTGVGYANGLDAPFNDDALRVLICETTGQQGGQCLAPATADIAITFDPNVPRTFSLFVRGQGQVVTDDPARNRIFVDFVAEDGTIRGQTSVAVTTAN
ncbi:hypothetical protein [Hyphobacterium sp.]|uniref:hypothetical protein n=1 Tax=Hyphobacterium sp. TaxID=2004662 RepID=UPI003BA8FD55